MTDLNLIMKRRWYLLHILLALLILCLSSPAQASRAINVRLKDNRGEAMKEVRLYGGSYALLVGGSRYTHGWPDLESVPGELARVERLLQDKGFVVEKKIDPDHRELQKVFESFINRYGYEPQNRLLFFYSGHGHTRKEGKRGYLVPVDAPNPNKDKVGFLRKALDMNLVLSWARTIEAKHALFLFDSCFSGTIFKHKALPKPPKYITSLATEPVRQFITAGSAGETVPANSTFTPAFIDGLQHNLADLNRDGYVSGTELGLYLQQKVPEHADQSPQFGKIKDYDLSRGDFIFLAGGNPEVVTAPKKYPSTTGILKVTSAPSGAEVRIDGKVAGQTPVQLGNMVPGTVRVSVKKSGYLGDEQGATIKAGRRTVVSFELAAEPKSGWLSVRSSPADARVRILNITPAYSPGMELTAGRYHVEVSAAGHATETRWVELAAGDDLTVDISLTPRRAAVATAKPQPAASRPSGRSYTDPTTGMEFVWVEGGCFQLGQTEAEKRQIIKERGQEKYNKYYKDELPRHEVCLDGYYMGKYEVTQGEYQKITGSNPSKFDKGDRYPVEKVSWEDAQAFIKKLNSRSGRTYRLPTEAEWEYAARGGTTTARPWGNDISCDKAMYENNVGSSEDSCVEYVRRRGLTPDSTAPVGSYSANPFGLYDMLGNVWEWCRDWYDDDYYSASPRRNPTGPSSGSYRVVRGGSWGIRPAYVRSAVRGRIKPGDRNGYLGFRLVLSGQ